MKRLVMIAAATVMLAGCSAQPTPEPTATTEAVTAAETCKQASNVLTVLANAGVSRFEERSTDDELAESIALADSMLDEVQTEPATEYEDILQRLRAFDTDEYQIVKMSNGSDSWRDTYAELNELCTADGSELEVTMWTGG